MKNKSSSSEPEKLSASHSAADTKNSGGPSGEDKKDNRSAEGKKKNKKWSTVLLIFIFILGLGILLYPTVSNWWNSFHASRAIANYAEAISKISEDEYQRMLADAKAYNASLPKKQNQYSMSDAELKEYDKLLDPEGQGVIGYIEIDKIKVSLPIYHGTADSVLQIAVGHVDWTSLPLGGESTHTVLSGHRGLPSAKLFTDLDELEIGDTFVMRILNEVITYEIDQILIVLPSETEDLKIIEGQDLCTLVTCTPYGINTHRLLVRGHRVENAEEAKEIHITSDATRVEPLIMAPIIAAPMLIILLIIVIINDRHRTRAAKKAKDSILKKDF